MKYGERMDIRFARSLQMESHKWGKIFSAFV